MHYLVEDMHVFITPLSQFPKAPSTYSKIERSVGGPPTPKLSQISKACFKLWCPHLIAKAVLVGCNDSWIDFSTTFSAFFFSDVMVVAYI